jgi:hypothetical protein
LRLAFSTDQTQLGFVFAYPKRPLLISLGAWRYWQTRTVSFGFGEKSIFLYRSRG